MHTLPLPSHAAWHNSTASVSLSTGIRMSYFEGGTPGKLPLLLIHGFSDSSRIWRTVISLLQQDFHIFSIDLRGCGQSDQPDSYVYSMAQHAADLLAFLDAMQLRSVCVMGHSMGSMIAQTLAFSAPERVKKLVLASTMTHMRETAADVLAMDRLYTTLNIDATPERALQESFLPYPEKCFDKDFPSGYLSTLRLLSGKGLAAAWRGMSLTDNRNFFQFIQAPVLVLWGEEDGIFTEDYQQEVRGCLPHAAYISLPHVAHEIPSEVPQLLAEHAKRFFLSPQS